MTQYLVITMDNCPYCDKAKALMTDLGLSYREINIMEDPTFGTIPALLGRKTLPLILRNIGGFDDFKEIVDGQRA